LNLCVFREIRKILSKPVRRLGVTVSIAVGASIESEIYSSPQYRRRMTHFSRLLSVNSRENAGHRRGHHEYVYDRRGAQAAA
jgi:hypothetical protein